MAKIIKIFGERNTSTNALRILIEQNSDSRIAPSVARALDPKFLARLDLFKRPMPYWLRERMIDRVFKGRSSLEAWKHAATYFDDAYALAGCHVIFCVRHPASWLLGLHRHPYHVPPPFPKNLDAFLEKRWKTVGRERLSRMRTTATMLYNRKILAYARLQTQLRDIGVSYSIVRHEDFVVDQGAVFAGLEANLMHPSPKFTPLEASTKDRSKTRKHYQDYYGNERWLDEIDSKSKDRILAEIDWAAVTSLNYAPW